MSEFNMCDIVVVTAKHPIGCGTITQGELGLVAEIGQMGPVKCYRVQHASRNRKEGFFYAPDEIRKATPQEIKEELIRLMLVDWEAYQ